MSGSNYQLAVNASQASDPVPALNPIQTLKTPAPYLKLKNSKRTSKCQKYFLLQHPENFFEIKSHNAEKAERGKGPSGIFQHPFCRKTEKKIEGGLWGTFFSKKVSIPKTERRTL